MPRRRRRRRRVWQPPAWTLAEQARRRAHRTRGARVCLSRGVGVSVRRDPRGLCFCGQPCLRSAPACSPPCCFTRHRCSALQTRVAHRGAEFQTVGPCQGGLRYGVEGWRKEKLRERRRLARGRRQKWERHAGRRDECCWERRSGARRVLFFSLIKPEASDLRTYALASHAGDLLPKRGVCCGRVMQWMSGRTPGSLRTQR